MKSRTLFLSLCTLALTLLAGPARADCGPCQCYKKGGTTSGDFVVLGRKANAAACEAACARHPKADGYFSCDSAHAPAEEPAEPEVPATED